MNLLAQLRAQHEEDLLLYRQAHQDPLNRGLHWLCIPLETLAFLGAVGCACGRTYMHAWAWTLAILSLLLSPTLVGQVAAAFHVVAAHLLERHLYYHKQRWELLGVLWCTSWVLQVGVGHYWFEGNQPNLVNDSVSWLALTQSVLMAWKS